MGRKTRLVVGFTACIVVLLVAPPLGAVVALSLRPAPPREATSRFDPTATAAALGERTATGLYGAYAGFGVSLLTLIPTVILGIRLFRAPASQTANATDEPSD